MHYTAKCSQRDAGDVVEVEEPTAKRGKGPFAEPAVRRQELVEELKSIHRERKILDERELSGRVQTEQ